MTIDEAIMVLELHNAWRKGADIEMQSNRKFITTKFYFMKLNLKESLTLSRSQKLKNGFVTGNEGN